MIRYIKKIVNCSKKGQILIQKKLQNRNAIRVLAMMN